VSVFAILSTEDREDSRFKFDTYHSLRSISTAPKHKSSTNFTDHVWTPTSLWGRGPSRWTSSKVYFYSGWSRFEQSKILSAQLSAFETQLLRSFPSLSSEWHEGRKLSPKTTPSYLKLSASTSENNISSIEGNLFQFIQQQKSAMGTPVSTKLPRHILVTAQLSTIESSQCGLKILEEEARTDIPITGNL